MTRELAEQRLISAAREREFVEDALERLRARGTAALDAGRSDEHKIADFHAAPLRARLEALNKTADALAFAFHIEDEAAAA